MGNFNFFNTFFDYLRELMNAKASLFEAFGNQLFAAFAVIIVCWYGIQTALKGEVMMSRFIKMLLSISFGFVMIRFYSHPIPGVGISFYHLIVDQGTSLANQLNDNMVSQLIEKLSSAYSGLEAPGLLSLPNIADIVGWALITLALIVTLASVFCIIGFGYIATAICVLLGPVFIPFFIVPGLEWIFWGWFRAFLQYCFYPVVANAYVFVMGSLLINFIDRSGTDYSGAKIAALLVPMLILLFTFAWGIFKIPSLVNSIFTGKSGESIFQP